MNYKNKNIIVTGSSGFIGSAVSKALLAAGANVVDYEKEIRRKDELKELINHSIDYVFHFAAPSSQVLFKRNPDYCVDVTINGFLNVSRLCRKYGVKLIYPSTGLLSQGVENEYARCKKILEDIHLGSGLDALGLRIFAGYGVGEGHKRDFASVPYIFVRDIFSGRKPVVFGTGKQSRDFIYIDDLTRAILVLAEEANEQIVDIGSGASVTFNEILEWIGSALDQEIRPEFVNVPENYIDKTKASLKILQKYNCLPKISFQEGIDRIVQYEKSNRNDNN